MRSAQELTIVLRLCLLEVPEGFAVRTSWSLVRDAFLVQVTLPTPEGHLEAQFYVTAFEVENAVYVCGIVKTRFREAVDAIMQHTLPTGESL